MKKTSHVVVCVIGCLIHFDGAADLTGGLLAHYPLNGDAVDVSGNGFDGTANEIEATEDRFGTENGAVLFNGSSSSINCGLHEELNLTNDFSVTAWVRSTKNSGWQGIVLFDRFGHYGYGLCLMTAGYAAGWIGNGTAWAYASSPDVLRGDSQWRHLATVRRNGVLWLYVGGVLQESSTEQGVAYKSNRLIIGNSDPGDNPFGGAIDDVRIYARALSDDEVEELAQTPSGLEALTLRVTTDGQVEVGAVGMACGVSYQLQRSDCLCEAATWSNLWQFTASGATTNWLEAVMEPKAFYRLSLP